MNPISYMLGCVFTLILIFVSAIISGCGTGGEEDDVESSSSASTELTQCDFVIPESQIEAVLEDVEEAGDEAKLEELGSIPNFDGGLDQQTRLYKVTIIGCNNQVVTEDNDSDDDISTSVEVPQGDE
jgi:hypothetical protein